MSFFSAPRPRVFAHRGGGALAPENTCEAFDRGLAAGADGLEFDVRLSADGVLMVIHDETLERTTDGVGTVASFTASELSTVDAGYRFGVEGQYPFRGTGVRIPTLQQVLRRYPRTPMIIEMKGDSPELGEALADEVRAANAAPFVCAAGYGLRSLTAARAKLPEMASSACRPEVQLSLWRSIVRYPVRNVAYGGYQVPETSGMLRIVSPRWVRDARRAGLQVQVWTVDEPEDMVRLLKWGVHGLITNRPDLAVPIRDAFIK